MTINGKLFGASASATPAPARTCTEPHPHPEERDRTSRYARRMARLWEASHRTAATA